MSKLEQKAEESSKGQWIVEVRSHSVRDRGKGLTKQGWDIAKQARKTLLPSYLFVISSPKRRCRETAEAFGFKDCLIDKRFSTLQKKEFKAVKKEMNQVRKETQCSWFQSIFEVEGAKKILKEQGIIFLKTLKSVAKNLPSGEKSLVISHPERIAAAALLNFPSYDPKEIGGDFGPCEGAIFYFERDKDRSTRVEIKKLSADNG